MGKPQIRLNTMKVSITCDKDVWHDFQKVALKYGLSASYLCQVIMASVVDGDKRGVSEITRNMMIGMVQGARDMKAKDKQALIEELSKPD